jgi:hypothetical protein
MTVLLKEYQDKIISQLVGKGYNVGPANPGIAEVNRDNPSYLIALSIYKLEEEPPIRQVYDDVIGILQGEKFYFYSVIIAPAPEAAWSGSNIILIKNDPALQLPVPDKNNSKLN